MPSRLKLGYVIVALAGISVLGCGDDSGSSGDSAVGAGAGGANPPRTGSSGSAAAGRGASGRGGAGGRGGTTRGMMGQMCPMTEPSASESCMPAAGNCMFGTRICDCIAPGNTWACWDPSQCPTAVPAEQSSCPVVGMTCRPMRGNCTCRDTGWDCGNQFCPAAEPALGGQCEAGTGTCMYGARICDCISSTWSCWNPADCPMSPPADNAMCSARGMACMYPGGSCTCGNMSTWRCGRGVMNDNDAGI
jgi:hypothetical protein